MSSDNETRNLLGGSSEEVPHQRIASSEGQGPSVSNAGVVPQEYNVLTIASFESLANRKGWFQDKNNHFCRRN